MPKPKVILSDLDGVLRTFPSHHSGDAEQELGMAPGGLLAVAFQKHLLEPAITGIISDEEWRSLIAAELAKTCDSTAVARAIAKWTAYPGKLDGDVHAIYKDLKNECKLALLTNATSKLNRDLKVLGVFDLFDSIFNTSEIGFAKPDARVFHFVLKALAVPAKDILFIDDRKENITVAQELGFRVHLFDGHERLRLDLN